MPIFTPTNTFPYITFMSLTSITKFLKVFSIFSGWYTKPTLLYILLYLPIMRFNFSLDKFIEYVMQIINFVFQNTEFCALGRIIKFFTKRIRESLNQKSFFFSKNIYFL